MGSVFGAWLKFEAAGEHILYQIVQVMAVDEPLSLVARVHGCPAVLHILYFSTPLHEPPHWPPPDRYRGVVGKEEQFSHFIHFNTLAEKLACMKFTALN